MLLIDLNPQLSFKHGWVPVQRSLVPANVIAGPWRDLRNGFGRWCFCQHESKLHPSSVQVRCMLNIWGVMLFIRMTWIVGQAGIGRFDFGRPCELALQFASKLLCFPSSCSHFSCTCWMLLWGAMSGLLSFTGTVPKNTGNVLHMKPDANS